MKWKEGLVFIILLCIVIWIPSQSNVEGGEVSRTIIKGTVTDAETGLPVENAYVMIRNYTREIFFYYLTSENGSYEFSIGSDGNFFVEVDGPVHHYVSQEVGIGRFEEIEVNFQIERYENNVMVFFCNEDENYPLDDLEVIITDEDEIETSYHTTENGWLNVSLDHGNYSMRTNRDFLETYQTKFNISNDRVFRRFEFLRTANVYDNASKKLVTNPLDIPPKEFKAIKIIDDEPTSMYLTFQGDGRITISEMTQIMFDKYLSIHTGIPYSHDEDPYMEYDFKLGHMQGGTSTVRVWDVPYYIVIENNNTEPVEIEYDLYYEYGDPFIASIESGTLEPTQIVEDEEVKPSTSELGALSLSTIIFAILMTTYTLIIMRRRDKK